MTSVKITSPIIIAASATTITPNPLFTSAYPLFWESIAPVKAIIEFDNISPIVVIFLVEIPNEIAILGLSPVAIRACPNSVLKNKNIANITINKIINPNKIISK